ncbi:hypothetical protein DESUT3_30960 [Desulfuromonas versatilis]|uniref:GPR1/FUN34/yaaH family protein n=1 Tax=Desulfuromonas versatilis TaxID=2802975 RepID=A0ABN6E114_9BACT|nr:acetate uptake transporter [Desulfuromonas versatilis]BCR06027.1 hypothetical protein DESUT3_30960 [Desulfuromonas versatilis]
MAQEIICPFYAKDDEYCDVGCGYISSHDAAMIIRHCSANFRACAKYRELAERLCAAEVPADPSGPGIETLGAILHPQDLGSSSRPPLPAAPLEQPFISPWGVLALGMAMLVFSLFRAGYLGSAPVAALGLFYLGVWQVALGFIHWKKRQAFGAATLGCLGVFWLSLISQTILPEAGLGQAPQAGTLAAYLGMWGMFSAVLLLGTLGRSRVLPATFALLVVLLFLLAGAGLAGSELLARIACFHGIAGGLAASAWGLAKTRRRLPARHQARLEQSRRSA